MKKIIYCSLLFAGISAVFGLCYYLSFRNALLHYNREAVEQNTQMLQEILESSGESERLLQQIIEENELAVAAATTEETLRATANYVLETRYLQSQTENKEQLAVPGFMVGINREELETFVRGYMEELPVNEYLAGLVSYEIVSFSSGQVVLRKVYDEAKVTDQFFLCKRGDFIVVYYSDLKTVYEYTEILCSSLPVEEQQALEQGFYVKDTQELYSVLEGYTS